MGKQTDKLKRLLAILNKLKGPQKYVSTEKLLSYINDCMLNFDSQEIEKRTLERDIKDIEDLFGIIIKFSRKYKGYYIEDEDEWRIDRYEYLLMDFELLVALGEDTNLHSYVLAEHIRPAKSPYLSELIRAIKGNHPVTFDYTYIRQNDTIRSKKVRPHYLKEDQHRWYLLAIDEDDVLKTFSIDSIDNLQVLFHETFKRNVDINIKELFKYSYGIWNQESIPIEEVELAYSPLDGKFLKRLPLHHSQEILIDNEEEFRIRVTLRITNDFVMALLARSASLTVIKPLHLQERINEIYQQAINRNK